jgi:hypothetical protein
METKAGRIGQRRRVKKLELCKKSPNKGYVVHRYSGKKEDVGF